MMTLAGVFTPVPTPFDADDRLDTARLRAAFARRVASPIAGFVVLGSSGGILALGSVVPDACVRLFELTRGGRHDEARALQRQLMPLARLLGSTHKVPGLKAALRLLGCDVGYPRLPLLPLAEPDVAAIGDALRAFQEIPA